MSENTENKVININNTEVNNKITVKEFVKKYNTLTSDEEKIVLVNQIL